MKSIICDSVFYFSSEMDVDYASLHLKMLVRTRENAGLSSLKECSHRSDWKFQLVGMFCLLLPHHSITSLSHTVLSLINSVYSEPN